MFQTQAAEKIKTSIFFLNHAFMRKCGKIL